METRTKETTIQLAQHLHPQTYWEQRCQLLEESVVRMMNILAQTALPPHAVEALRYHCEQWNELIAELAKKHTEPGQTA